jgi:hypothetical protein
MHKLIIKHCRIEVHNYTLGDCPSLELKFQIWNDQTYSYEFRGIDYNSKNKILYLPRGYDIVTIENYLGVSACIDMNCDPYDIVGDILLSYRPRDEVQEEAIAFMIGRGKYSNNKKKSQLMLNLPTGKGKTYCSIVSASYFKTRTIIIASNNGWLEQWKNFIIEYTNTQFNEILFLIGSDSIERVFKRGVNGIKFILASHMTIKSYAEREGWDKIDELFKVMKVGTKIYDEAHLNFGNIMSIDFHSNTMRNWYVTATPAKSDRNDNIIYKNVFKNVPSINLFREDLDPHTKYIALLYNSHPSDKDLIRCTNAYGFNRTLYTNTIINKQNFYYILTIIIDMALKNDGKNLIYIGTNESILAVYNWILMMFPELVDSVGVYTSIVDNDKKANQLEKKIILSTTKSCGAASDIKGLKMTVVLAEPFKSEVIAKQTLGRTRDPNTLYIECVDMGYPAIQRYYRQKKKIFEKYATDCTQVIITDDELFYRVQMIVRSRNCIPSPMMLKSPIIELPPL